MFPRHEPSPVEYLFDPWSPASTEAADAETFEDFLRELEDEAHEQGPEAMEHLESLRAFYCQARDVCEPAPVDCEATYADDTF